MFGINRDLLFEKLSPMMKSFIGKQKENIETLPPPDENLLEHKLRYVNSLDFSHEDLRLNQKVLGAQNREPLRTLNWFIPNPTHILYGGIYTILRFAHYFQKNAGIQNRLIFCGGEDQADERKRQISAEFEGLDQAEFFSYDGNLDRLPSCDATIATLWNTCYLSVKFQRTKKKFYFIQDYESLFSAAGSVHSALAEATYRLGFRGIVNTPGLYDFLVAQHGLEGRSFHPCVDPLIYHINRQDVEKKLQRGLTRIVFYGRPNKDRNAFEIGLASLLKVKARYQDQVEILSVGDDWRENDYGVEGRIKNLGRIGSFSEVADVYRQSDIGAVMMFTKHPSYQPFEFMASACAVVSNVNDANAWFLKDGENCLISEPTPSCFAERISELVDDRNLRERLVSNGLVAVSRHSWDGECAAIAKYINA
jgi:O-antigen biosynthesis protein